MNVYVDEDGLNPEYCTFCDGDDPRPYTEMPDNTDLSKYIVDGGVLRLMTSEELLAIANEEALKQFKAERPALVEAIKVTVDGFVFDGDEVSQTRMSRAITVMDDIDFTYWTLANNETVSVTKAQLKEALKLAGQAQTDLWTMP